MARTLKAASRCRQSRMTASSAAAALRGPDAQRVAGWAWHWAIRLPHLRPAGHACDERRGRRRTGPARYPRAGSVALNPAFHARARVPRPPGDAQSASLVPAGRAQADGARGLPLRRLRSGGGGDRARGDHRAAAGVGDGAVSLVCASPSVLDLDVIVPVAGRNTHAGTRHRPRRRSGDLHRQRGARQPHAGDRGPMGADAGRAAARRTARAPPALPTSEGTIHDQVEMRVALGRYGARARRHAERRRTLGAVDPPAARARPLRRRARHRRRLGAVGHRPGARPLGRRHAASTTPSASSSSCRPTGCSATSRCTASPRASATAASTCGARRPPDGDRQPVADRALARRIETQMNAELSGNPPMTTKPHCPAHSTEDSGRRGLCVHWQAGWDLCSSWL